jgi:hypothetical protein
LNSKQHFSNRHEAMNSVSGEPWCGILCGDSLGTVPVGIHPQSPRSDTTRCRDFGIGDGRGWIPEFLLIVSSYSFLTFFWLFALTAIRNPKKKTRIPIRNAGFHKSGGDLISTFKVAHPILFSIEGTLALPARLPGLAACRTVPDDEINLHHADVFDNTVLCHKT